MAEKMRIALAQINTIVGDFAGNSRKVLDYVEKAKVYQADVIIFPELTLCGYPPEDLLHKPKFIEDSGLCLEELARKIKDITAIIGFVRQDGADIYNSAAVVSNGNFCGFYDKMYLPNYSVFDEKRYFKSGKCNLLFDICGIKAGINICEDIWHPDGPYKAQKESGAQIIFNLSASPYYVNKHRERQCLISNIAVKERVHFAFVNLVGGQDELVFDGASSFFSPEGKIMSSARQFQEDVLIVEAEFPVKNNVEKKNLEVIKIDTMLKEKTSKVEMKIEEERSAEWEVYSALTLGLKDYVVKNGFEKVVLGISGGIDSAFAAAVAVDALGRDNVIGVIMPSKYSSDQTQKDAKILADNLGIKSYCLPIGEVFNEYLDSLGNIFKGLKENETEENLQARVRGNFLMALSNKFGWLVLTTGNKSEMSVGYCTLYGDMAGGFAVIKDVPKTLVYKLSNYVNNVKGKEVIPLSILERAPSAELKFNQKDQDSLPEYEILDAILKEYIENDKGLEQIISLGFDRTLVTNIISKVDRNEYKRRQAPPGIKITEKAFGRDRRMPIVNKYR
jgi:NAD+ synthase (glutamine-hydrolysing)